MPTTKKTLYFKLAQWDANDMPCYYSNGWKLVLFFASPIEGKFAIFYINRILIESNKLS